jgi:hypothetical protein
MAMRISERDLETLSNYLDGQLTAGERARLEARLQTELELRTVLEQLRQTRAAVRNLPFLRAPRNYTLTPKIVGERKRPPRLYPVLRLASALASFLFILALIGDLITVRTPGIASLQAVQLAGTSIAAVEEPVSTEAALLESAASVVETAEPAEKLATGAEEPVLTVEATVVAELQAPAPPAPQEPEAAVESLEAGAADQVPAPRLQAKAEVSVTSVEPVARFVPTGWTPLRILTVFLAILALSTGLAALYLRRRSTKPSPIR